MAKILEEKKNEIMEQQFSDTVEILSTLLVIISLGSKNITAILRMDVTEFDILRILLWVLHVQKLYEINYKSIQK